MRVLARLHDHLHLRPQDPLAPDLVRELRQALDRYAEGATLDAALLNGDRGRRDSALRRAAELIAPSAGAWGRSAALLSAIARFEASRREPRTVIEHAIAVALAAGAVPRSRRQLYRLLLD